MSLLLMLLLSTVPQNASPFKGATPSASDAVTPVPEEGKVAAGRYRNAYFNLSYPIPAGWTAQPAGPPPSEAGAYTLAQFALVDPDRRLRAHVMITVQDFFFALIDMAGAKELVSTIRRGLEPVYQLDAEPDQVTIAGRTFHRLSYHAPRSGLRWRILSTDARCHALTFTFAGADPAALDAAEQAMRGISLGGKAPLCQSGYDEVVEKSEPRFTTNRYNTIPVRVIIDATGRVKHAHLLSAYPEQSEAILSALRAWRFKPYRVGGKAVEVETGLVFGMPLRAGK
ncbi:MAG TPA: hypothetical protein VKB93_22860 [Thermoanaerobaculia bacterium]|nr:hypothetical protein [Thermoanaerobaculia bacterium]